MTEDKIHIWTDGACSGNPGAGGWGALLKYQENAKEIFGGEAHTTNNRMELMGAIEGLKALKKSSHVVLYTDSAYVKNGITQWVHGWQKNNWKNSQKQDVKNKDLWMMLLDISKNHTIEWQWVKGHAGDTGNEHADRLACKGRDLYKKTKSRLL